MPPKSLVMALQPRNSSGNSAFNNQVEDTLSIGQQNFFALIDSYHHFQGGRLERIKLENLGRVASQDDNTFRLFPSCPPQNHLFIVLNEDQTRVIDVLSMPKALMSDIRVLSLAVQVQGQPLNWNGVEN